MIEKTTVGIVGVGHVGAHVAYSLGMMGIADEILLCDIDAKKLASECNDLNDAVPFMPHRVQYKTTDYAGLKDCAVIVNAVGDISLCRNFNRDDELKNSVVQVARFIPRIMDAGFDGIFVNITNPCDLITAEIANLSGLPRSQVMGTGTLLDSARLCHALSDATGLDSRSFNAFMLGQHGNAQFVPWSLLNFSGMTVDQYEKPRNRPSRGAGWRFPATGARNTALPELPPPWWAPSSGMKSGCSPALWNWTGNTASRTCSSASRL